MRGVHDLDFTKVTLFRNLIETPLEDLSLACPYKWI